MRIALSSQAQSGLEGSFALDANYTLPTTGLSYVFVIVINVTPSAAATDKLPSTPVSNSVSEAAASPLTSSSWALGAGLCDSSSTGSGTIAPCNGSGIVWSYYDAVDETFTVPSYTNSVATTYIELNANEAYDSLLQVVLIAPASGSTWQMQAWALFSNGGSCHFNTGTTSSGRIGETLELYWVSGLGWLEYNQPMPLSYQYSNYCSGMPSSSSFYDVNQEPFAVESL